MPNTSFTGGALSASSATGLRLAKTVRMRASSASFTGLASGRAQASTSAVIAAIADGLPPP